MILSLLILCLLFISIDCSILNHFIKYPDLSLIENVENELRKRQQSSSIVEKLITTITNSFKTEYICFFFKKNSPFSEFFVFFP